MRRQFTFLAFVLLILFSLPTSAQFNYVIQVKEPYTDKLPVKGVNLGWGEHIAPRGGFDAIATVVIDSSGSNLGCVGSVPDAYEGKIAIVRRDGCSFIQKVTNAYNSGAIAVVIVNSKDSIETDFGVLEGTVNLSLLVMMVSFEGGDHLISAIEGGAISKLRIVRQPLETRHLNIIWGGPGHPNSEFDGGLNDWTTSGVYCDGADPELAKWIWGKYVRSWGGFSEAQPTIASSSSYNGAVIFDSGFLDNEGVQTSIGEGPCPGPHRGELISPVIDMSDESKVAIRFHQLYRRFAGPGSSQDVPGSYIEVTNDGGVTWMSIPINTDLKVNAQTPVNDVQVIDISQVAAGQPEVQFKFVFDGNYYFWQIDDVYLIALPDNSIEIDRVFSPIATRYTPENHMGAYFGDESGWQFSAALKNSGGNIVNNAKLRVSISNEAGDYFLNEIQNAPSLLPAGGEEVFQPDILFDPKGLPPGNYRLQYSVFQEGIDDFDPSNNTEVIPFSVVNSTDNWQSGELRRFIYPATLTTETWGFAALFKTFESNFSYYFPSSVEIAVSSISGIPEDLAGQMVKVSVIEDKGIVSGDEIGDHSNEVVARGEYVLSPGDDGQKIDMPLYNIDVWDPVRLENDRSYLVLVEVPNGLNIGIDNEMLNYPISLNKDQANLYSRLYINGAFSATFRNSTPYIMLKQSWIFNLELPELPDASVRLFPNPASDHVNVKLNFDTATNTTIALCDIHGKVIDYATIPNVKEHTEIINTSNLAEGNYLIQLGTAHGVKVRKLVVVR